jgi:hypothetical protein
VTVPERVAVDCPKAPTAQIIRVARRRDFTSFIETSKFLNGKGRFD